jgi:hypothetical protein
MPAKKTETSNEVIGANLYVRLLAARTDFANLKVQQSGVNNHAEFTYYELSDIVPPATEIFAKYHCVFITTFVDGQALGKLIDVDKPENHIDVSFPAENIKEPAKFRMNEVQATGAGITYMRRYLYYLILDITQPDELDPQVGVTPTVPHASEQKKAPATTEERAKIKETLTGANGNADELQIKALKEALKKLREVAPDQEEFIQEVALKTNGFKDITKSACEKLITGISEMIEKCGG